MMVEKSKTNPPTKATIYIDVEDEITSIIDKVEAADAKLAALVLPKKSSALQSIVNMRLLKRGADDAGKKIVLITNDQKILPLAGAASVYVAKNLQSKPYIPASPVPVRGQTAVADEAESTDATKDPLKKPTVKDKKLKIPNFDKFRLRLVLIIAGIIGLIVFLFLATKVLPKAAITIQTTSTPVSANFDLTTADSAKAVDSEKSIVPAVLKTSDQTSTQQVPATGQQNKGEKASGPVTLKNCGTSVVTVPAGTAVSTGGLVYITQAAKSLGALPAPCPSTGANTADVDVVAQTPGAKYNVGAGQTFAVSGYSNVSASNAAAFSGGGGRGVPIF